MNEETTGHCNNVEHSTQGTNLTASETENQDIKSKIGNHAHEVIAQDLLPVKLGSPDPNLYKCGVSDMKLIHGEDVTVSGVVDTRIMPHTCCSLLSSDMSTSLPNLFGDEMFTGRGMLEDTFPPSKGSLSDVTTNDKLRYKTMSLEDCQQKGSRNNGSTYLEEEMDHNKLSSVLERISLVYLPQTKQLVSRKSSDIAVNPDPNSLSYDNNDHDIGSEHVTMLPTRECPEGAESLTSNGPNITAIQQSPHRLDSLNFTYPDPKIPTLELPDNVQEGTPENIVILSQESDISAHSHSTVINCHHQDLDFVDLTRGSSCTSQDNHKTSDDDADNDIDSSQEDEGRPTTGGLLKLNVTDPRDSAVSDLGRPTSLSRTDASSFSSISSLSTGTEHSVSYSDVDTTEKPIVDTDEAGFVDINLDARSVSDQNFLSRTNSQDSGIVDANAHVNNLPQGAKPKKKGLSFLTRNIFSRKVKESPSEGAPLGWRLFGKVPPKEPSQESITTATTAPAAAATATASCDKVMVKCKPEAKPDVYNHLRQGGTKVKRTDVEAPSTTALILENRPQGLPSKDPEEELRHRQQYEAMVEAAKKKELREAKLRKKQLQQQLKHEDALSAAVKTWNTEILPNWDNMRISKKARDLWWNGIPPSVRGKVWKLAIGNDLNLTSELYEICLSRAKDRLKIMREAGSDTDSVSSFSMFADLPSSKEASVELIKLDVSRTFPQLCIFQKRGPYHELLQGLLGAYACYRPDVGYVQGMSFIAAVLLLNMDVDDAFICFANLLNRPCQIAFFRLDETLMNSYFETYEAFFMENLPKLFGYFKKQNVTPNLYIIDWLFTLYAKSLPLDVASRVWDVFCRDGEEFLFRTALGILKLHEDILLNMDFIHLAQFLTRLPENISSDQLFSCIDAVHMSIDKRRFYQVLADAQEQNRPPTDS